MSVEPEIQSNVRNQFDNSFDVPLSAPQAWRVLSDVRRISTCIPGLELTRVVDNEAYEGRIVLVLGSANLNFGIVGWFEHIDPVARTARLKVHGIADAGLGAADVHVSFRLVPVGIGSTIFVHTDFALSGPAAYFGGSVSLLQRAAADIMSRFAANLWARFVNEQTANEQASAPAPACR
jgi:carbon monoxide dehydrogenase subunit G